MKIILAGGTGFIGRYFARRFREQGHDVIVISRQTGDIRWDEPTRITAALEGAGLLINLAGKSVNCRYNDKNKKAILSSRTDTTKLLGQCLLKCQTPPPLWVNAGTAAIYRHAEDRPMDERSGEIGKGFSVEVARGWEAAFFGFDIPGTRQLMLRITIVLGKNGGVFKPYRNMVLMGFGGRQGSGRQMFSWIHIEDLYRIVLFALDHSELEGVVNCAAPEVVTNTAFMKQLRKAMHVPFGLPVPEPVLKLGAVLIGTETELLLKSRWVTATRLQEAGFVFKFERLDAALEDLFGRK